MRKISPESQKIEYKSSWQNDYFEWICGYANSKGGILYIGVNDDGYIVGLYDTRYLLDTLPNLVVDKMGIVIEIDYDAVSERGVNIKYSVVPDDIAQKPENLYVRGILTEKALADIIADPANTTNVTEDVQKLFDAAPLIVETEKRVDPAVIASIDRMMEILVGDLSETEKEIYLPIAEYLKTHDTIKNADIMRLTQRGSSSANRYLNRLVELKILNPEGDNKGRFYRRVSV